MADGRRTRWVAHDVYFLDEGLGHAMFERFGGIGIALWHGFIAACKKNHIEGQTSWSSDVEALQVLGLPGMSLVDNDGVPFTLDEWMKLLSDHKVIRRTSRGRRVKVACTKWTRWQHDARRAREAARKAKDRSAEGEQNRRSDEENTRTSPGQPPDETLPDTDTDTDTELLGEDKPRKPKPPDPIWDAVMEACGLNQSELTESARGAANNAVKQLRDIGASPEGIKARARKHREAWPQATCTPASLAKNYAQLGSQQSQDRASLIGTGGVA